MSKKLFAAATAAALALTALVGVAPASANFTFGVTAVGQTSTASGLVEGSPLAINVPSQDVLRVDESTPAAGASVTASVIRLNIQAATTSTAVRVVATGGIKVLSETQWSAATKRTATGSSTLDTTSNSTDGKVNVYVYTTSTATGSVTITQGGNSRVLYVKGANALGYAYNAVFTAPTTADVSGNIIFTGSLTDVFGNKIVGLTGAATDNVTLSGFGVAVAATPALSTGDNVWTESTTAPGTYTFGVQTTATAGTAAIGVSTKTVPVKPTNLAAPAYTQFFTVTTASLSAQVTALQAQVAALTAQLQATVTKAKYNKLAKRWNRANPSNKVKLQK
jgi:hypothetical protein